jgi:hypothetical protein
MEYGRVERGGLRHGAVWDRAVFRLLNCRGKIKKNKRQQLCKFQLNFKIFDFSVDYF